MKTKILIISIIAVFMATLSVEAQNKKTNHNKTVTFEVTMTCENCKKTIEKNILESVLYIPAKKWFNDIQFSMMSYNIEGGSP